MSVLQVQEFLARFENIPDMLELDHLTVSGDVTFGKNVSLKVNDARRLFDLRPLRRRRCFQFNEKMSHKS